MGNSQYCCNYKDLNDPHAQDFNEKGITLLGGKGAPSPIQQNAQSRQNQDDTDQIAKDELLKAAKKVEHRIVLMQAKIRGNQ